MRDYCWLTNRVVVCPFCIMNKVPLGKVVLYLASVSSTFHWRTNANYSHIVQGKRIHFLRLSWNSISLIDSL